MTRWLMVLLLAAVSPAWAIDCTDPNNDGLVCLMSDNATQGGCSGGACVRTYTIPGNAARTGTGTISSSGATVTGSGTVFTSELHVGDDLVVNSQRVAIMAIISATSLTTSPNFSPAISAGSAFTYINPIVRWLDSDGTAIAVLNSLGFLAVGLPYADLPLHVVGRPETTPATNAHQIVLQASKGGPASATLPGGGGGSIQLLAGDGGSSAVSGKVPGDGSIAFLSGGDGGATSVAGDPDGAGGTAWLTGGTGGSGGGGNGAAGGPVWITGGNGSSPLGTSGYVRIRVGSGVGNSATPIKLCDDGIGIVTVGSTVKTNVDCATGNITKIKNVPVAGMWNVNAFQQANAGGM